MTYCLAWKVDNAVFFVADAAVTGGSGALRTPMSSFGEAHKAGPEKVEQGALKIFRLPQERGLTFAGDVRVGDEIVRVAEHLSLLGDEAADVARGVVNSVCPVAEGIDEPVAAVGSVMNGKAELVWLDTIDGTVHPVPSIVQLGSLGRGHKNLSGDFVKELLTFAHGRLSGKVVLVSGMALVQSYGIHHALIDLGIGGHITGACIDEWGWHWHPDLLFMIYSSGDMRASMKWVMNVVRDNVVVVRSSITNDVRVFAHALTPQQLPLWREKWDGQLASQARARNFDYVVFLDTRTWRVVIVEMHGEKKNKHLQFGAQGDLKTLTTSRDLNSLLTKPPRSDQLVAIEFQPFEEMA